MKKREEIDAKYKWDLSSYVSNCDELEKNLAWLKENMIKFKDYYGKFGDKNILKEFLKFDEEFTSIYEKTGSYIGHNLSVDDSNITFLKYSQQLDYISKDIGEITAFVQPQLDDLDEEYLKELIEDSELVDYRRLFEGILRKKPHKISEYDSQFLSKMSLCFGNYAEVYDNLVTSEIQFAKVKDGKGNTHEMNEANYTKFIFSADRELRKNTLNSLMNGYGGKVKTISSLYLSDAQTSIFYSKLCKFKGVRDNCLFSEEVDECVYNTLLKNINERIDVLSEIIKLRGKYLGLEDMAYYDIMADIGENKQKYTVEQAEELVKQCTKALGDEYQAVLEEKFNQHVIDYFPNENKTSGAYSSGAYGCPSIVLMNFMEDYNSVSTLAHEIGHAMHSELSDRAQPMQLAQYVIFVAEVASTVNEILLNLHVQKTASEQEKTGLILEILDSVRSTIFRQTMFSEFEDFVYSTLENQKPLTYEDLSNHYYELNQKYYPNIILPPELKYEWARISHFYRPYYVYKYATGLVSALCIVQNIMEDENYYKQYIKFLKSGSTKTPVELLQDIGVDLTTNKPYEKAFKFIEEQIKKLY